MKKIFLFIMMISGFTVFAQDIIVTKDSKKITGKILEVNTDNIKYKNWKNSEGPVYTLLKKDIVSILYENGEVETFKSNSNLKTPVGTCIDDPILDNVQRFGNKILIDNKTASSKEIKEMLRKTSPKSYKMYSAGRGLSKAGTILISTGGGLLLGGATCIIAGFDDDDEVIIMGLISAFGVVEIVTSIPLLITGKALKKKGIRYFDQNCLSDEPFKIKNYYQLNLNINTNGLGLSLAF